MVLIVNDRPGDHIFVALVIAHEMGIFIFERSNSSNQNYNYYYFFKGILLVFPMTTQIPAENALVQKGKGTALKVEQMGNKSVLLFLMSKY